MGGQSLRYSDAREFVTVFGQVHKRHYPLLVLSLRLYPSSKYHLNEYICGKSDELNMLICSRISVVDLGTNSELSQLQLYPCQSQTSCKCTAVIWNLFWVGVGILLLDYIYALVPSVPAVPSVS